MSIVETEDGAGYRIELLNVEGLCYPKKVAKLLFSGESAYTQHIEDIKNLNIREDDVMICTYPKSGTHWTWEIVSMLKQGTAEYETRTKREAMLEFQKIPDIEAIPSARVLNSHNPLHLLPKEVHAGKCKMIHVLRNPRDVAVSFYHFFKSMYMDYHGSFTDYLPVFYKENGKALIYSWFQYELEFEKFKQDNPHLPILTLFYEDMKKDLTAETKKISEFLGYKYDDKLIADIAERCQFTNMQQADKDVKKHQQRTNPATGQPLPKPNVYRKGEVGDWKNWFTVAQDEQMEGIYAERMQGSKLKFTFSM